MVVLYRDESGSITLSDNEKFKYFYIGFVTTSDAVKVKRVFRQNRVHCYTLFPEDKIEIKWLK